MPGHKAQVFLYVRREERSEISKGDLMKLHNRLALLTIVTTFASCGQFSFFKHPQVQREVASAAVEQMLDGSSTTFNEELTDQLKMLHQYYIIGHKHMADFDELLKTKELDEIYDTPAYRSLIVTRELAEEIEDSLVDVVEELSKSDGAKGTSKDKVLSLQKMSFMLFKLQGYSGSSATQKASMENLLVKIGNLSKKVTGTSNKDLFIKESENLKYHANKELPDDIEKQYKQEFNSLSSSSDFVIQQKNIEHLGLILDVGVTPKTAKYYPSAGKPGNITGLEFPEKVWALTFDDGPGKDSTLQILAHLKAKNLKASFFQLAQQVKANPKTSQAIKDAGMEIASHSWSHLQLTKVGPVELEKQITTATKTIEDFYGIDVKYFRLPYGAGVSNAAIRNKIADNKLIHVFWSIDTLDWMSQTPDKIVTRTLTMMKKSSKDAGIILMHDIHQRTAIASAEIMDYLKKDSRRTCVLDEIITQINEGAAVVCPLKK